MTKAKDTTQTLVRRAGAFLSGTALSRVTGMIRDILMAWAFGASSSVASFMVAFRFAHLLRRVLGEGAMQAAFIPQLVAARSQSEERAKHFFGNLSTILTLLLVIIIGSSEVVLGSLIYFDFLGSEAQEVCKLAMLMLPGLLFVCLFGINAALLQCEGRFFLSSGAPLAFNIVWILGVLALAGWASAQAMPWLAIVVTLACMGQWLVTVPGVSRLLGKGGAFPSLKEIDLRSPDLGNLLKGLSLGVIGVSASQIASAMDSVFAQYASPEGPAYLWFAIRLQQLPMSLLALALSGALLPALSRSIKAGNLGQGRNLLEFALRQNLLLIIPCTFGLVAAGGAIVNMLFGHGDFSTSATVETTVCLWAYAFGLPPLTLVLLLAPGFYALGDYKTPTRGSVITVIVNIALNCLAVGYWNLGPASVALMGGISAWINVLWLHVHLQRKLGKYLTSSLAFDFAKTLIASMTALMATVIVDVWLWQGNLLAQLVLRDPLILSRDLLTQVTSCATACTTFGIVWLVVGWLCGIDLMHAWRQPKADPLPI